MTHALQGTATPKNIDSSKFDVEAWRRTQAEGAAHNRAFTQQLQQKRREALAAVAAIWGENSRQYKYIAHEKLPAEPNLYRQWNNIMKWWWAYQEEERQRQKRREYAERRRQALEALEANGYIAGEHFAPGRALTFAKQVLCELEPGVYAPRGLPPGNEEAR